MKKSFITGGTAIFVFFAFLVPLPVAAADLAGLLKTQPVFSNVTSKNLYDVERCMIEVDAPIMPTVYRQPDRPQRAMLVWDGGGGIGGVVLLSSSTGWRRRK